MSLVQLCYEQYVSYITAGQLNVGGKPEAMQVCLPQAFTTLVKTMSTTRKRHDID